MAVGDAEKIAAEMIAAGRCEGKIDQELGFVFFEAEDATTKQVKVWSNHVSCVLQKLNDLGDLAGA